MRRSIVSMAGLALVAMLAATPLPATGANEEPFSFITGWGGPVGSGASAGSPADQIIPSGQWTPLIWGNRFIDEFGTDRGLDGVRTTVTSASNGASIGAVDVVEVADTSGFPDPAGRQGGDAYEWAMWQTSNGDLQVFRYQGLTNRSITGVSLGSSTLPIRTGDRIAPAPVSIYGVPASHPGVLQQGVVNVLWEPDPTESGIRLLRQTTYDGVLNIPWFHSDEMTGRNTTTQWQHFSFQPGSVGDEPGRYVIEAYQTSGADLRIRGVPARSPLLTMAGFSTSDGSGETRPPSTLTFPDWSRPPWMPGRAAGFVDVSLARHVAAVDWAHANGVTTGISSSQFGPQRPLTRGEAATMLWRLADRPPPPSPHRFVDVTASWQQEAVSWLAGAGITTGTTSTTFSPDQLLTRGQAAALLHRLVGSPDPTNSLPFTDITAPWQRSAVSWLAEAAITTGTSPTTFSPDDTVTRGDFAVLLYRLARHYQPGL